jgi:pimeloyl-ACP methyl ester carboxylesterase
MTAMRTGRLYGDMAYLAAGNGPPVVFIRTVMPSSDNPTGMTRWVEQRPFAKLARHFTVYSVSRRPGLKPSLTMADLAAQYAEAIEHDFGHPVNVIGLSTSGSISLQLAADHPQVVDRLVVVAASYRLGDNGRRMQRQSADLLAQGHYRKANAPLAPAITDSSLGQRIVAGLTLLTPRPADPNGMLAMLEAEDTFDLCDRLHEITAPTLVIGGDQDRFYPPDLVRRTANGIPDARLHMYRNRKHHTITRDPRFTTDIAAFLSSNEAATAWE